MQPSNSKQSKLPLYAALLANLAIAIVKLVASRISGSSAMLSESIHSFVDCANSLLLLRGVKRSKRPADKAHPFGHGKELYFYALIVSVMVFTLGGGMSIYEGFTHLQHPEPLSNPLINYVVLGIAIVIESVSLYLAVSNFYKIKGPGSFWSEMKLSKDPALFAIIYEDIAAMAGLVIALAGVVLSHVYNDIMYDGIASLLIGFVLCLVAGVMLWETRSLLIGESANEEVITGIYNTVQSDPDVNSLQRPVTMQLAPQEILVALEVEFKSNVNSEELIRIIRRIETNTKTQFPDISKIFIEAKSICQTCS